MKTILVIDDESVVRGFLSRLVESLGYKASLAAGAAEALAALEGSEVDIVIADVYLPDAPDAEEWIASLVRAAGRRRVILISGAMPGDVQKAAEANGIKSFLSKPFELAFLKKMLEEAG